VAAEVGRNYFEMRGLQQRLAVAERNLSSQQETLRLTRVRDDEGFGEPQDVASAAAHAAAIRASIPPIRNAIARREHRLAVLTAARPGALDVDLAPRPYPVLAKALPIGEPERSCAGRPDVRAAERRLAAATANEAIAAADLYPAHHDQRLSRLLAGRGNFFSVADTRAWAVTPALTWAAFDIGSARARLRGAEGATPRIDRGVRTGRAARARGNRERARHLSRGSATPRQARRASAGEQPRRHDCPCAVSRRCSRLSRLARRGTHRTAGRGRGRGCGVGVFTSVIAVYKALGGIPESSITGGAQP
jgi:multidrug efflux system outer membrane protein